MYETLIDRLQNPKCITESDYKNLCKEAAEMIKLLGERCSADKHNYITDVACAIPVKIWIEATEKSETIWGCCLLAIKRLSDFYEKNKR